MKRVISGALILVTALSIASVSYAGHGRGAMDGTGPISITFGCQGPANPAMQPGTGQQMQTRRGQSNGQGSRTK